VLPLVQPLQQPVEVGAGEAPIERHGGVLVATLEAKQAVLDLGEVGEVVGGQHLALHDREVDLHLVEPGRVGGQVDQTQVLPRSSSRAIEAWPRWLEPLSTIQNTRAAEA
jgi:hypothetical protein